RETLKIKESLIRNGIAHRLDKETSGVLLVAKTGEALKNLQEQFQQRKVEKVYIVLVHGNVADQEFLIDAPIGRNPKNKMKFGVVAKGKKALTGFRKIKEVEAGGLIYSTLEAYPRTGRTHQIRVHLAAYGYPVAGDGLYLGKNLFKTDSKVFGRMMLHARAIIFEHPKTGRRTEIKSDLPAEFKRLI
ncbi:RluA family pseudouridine synthase, partial [candidate division WWE3 bacterium]|nr:RluA family pseudouridine synthase [candidate division WWE3 bacterium]